MSWSEIICKSIKKATKAGIELSTGPLTSFLAPLGFIAPVVARAISFLAQELGGSIADWACNADSVERDSMVKEAVAFARGVPNSTRLSQDALAEHPYNNVGPPFVIPPRSAGAEALAASTAGGMPFYPSLHSDDSSGLSGFTPIPLPRPVVGLSFWPRMDTPAARRYEHWDRYQGTNNGQPHATFPKVGW